ncbi:MAG: hypothetical protein K5873_05950 [Treponema sp.]|nr:hypothetical protein [Treponema sp.]
MKISNFVNNSLLLSLGLVFSAALLSCGTTKVAEVVEEPVQEAEPVVEEVVQELPPVVEEPVVQAPVDDEYSRSVGDVSVSRDTFLDDKGKVLRIIKQLDGIMKDMDYKSWLPYVDDESIQYWSKSSNLKAAQKRLPVKGLRLKNLQDYFKFVFVPARAGREVTEIRYISDKYIKAIQTQDDQSDIVYYYFNKINGNWMVHIPPIDN